MFNLSYVQLGLRLFQFLALAASKLLKLQDNAISCASYSHKAKAIYPEADICVISYEFQINL